MSVSAIEITPTQDLEELNREIGEMEQQGTAAFEYFNTLLSDQLIFRRASGKVVGKSEPGGFLDSLNKNPFKSRVSENISVALQFDRVLVTLVVVGTRADDGSEHRYRNIRLFSRSADKWILEFWYNYEVTGL
jgi:hypothetical protein